MLLAWRRSRQHQIDQLDVEIASIVRKCCYFSPGTASASIHFGKNHGGLGVRSLAQDYRSGCRRPWNMRNCCHQGPVATATALTLMPTYRYAS
jgi:hypothetical protein